MPDGSPAPYRPEGHEPVHPAFGGDRFGQNAERVARFFGTPRYILGQSIIVVIWIAINAAAIGLHWDPYPFILLNLVLSFQAAFSAPIIMMSQNRQTVKDRLRAEADYAVNLRAELDVAAVHARLDELSGRQWAALLEVQHQQLELLNRIEALTAEIHRATKGIME
jgi:uncharacterized membrane protein